ncbi:MAG: 5'/3'-nucleotidase SurE [Anaerolineaceae bacterium]|nr:5'/3'-nucleotidase SurE [Anaerolineaceae bacterium]
MHILVTNDDGVHAPGLLALAQSMRTLGDVTVLAPDHNWSVSGHVKTLHRPLWIKEVTLADGTTALATDGGPSDCVALAVLGVLPAPVDFVVSGINPFPNLGNDLTYSGTVMAALEGVIWDIPSVAVSVDGHESTLKDLDYSVPAMVAAQIVELILANKLPEETLLNINVPNKPLQEIRGFRVTKQGKRVYKDVLIQHADPRGRPYYWIGGDAPIGVSEPDTDVGALEEGFVSINPIHCDLTAHHLFDSLKKWPWPVIS